MATKKPMMMKNASAGKKAAFKPCPGCPTPAACKARGQCAKKAMLRKAN